MSTLAINGGTPVISQPGPQFSWPPITATTIEAVHKQLGESVSIYDRSGIIAELEDALRIYFNVRHAVLTSSGTAAVHSAYVAAGIKPGDEVVVPAYTFLATATPLFHLGAIPVLADSDASGNVAVADVEAHITTRTAAIIVTHLWGIPAKVDELRTVADRHGLVLLEDASHAHGAALGQRKVGTFGRAGAFSMNGPKPLSAGEGGFVLTDDDETFYRVLQHGHYNKRCRNEIPANHQTSSYSVTGMGLKFRIHPLAAAIAHDQLSMLDSYLNGRQAVARHLCEKLGELPGIIAPRTSENTSAAWYGLPLTYKPAELGDLPIEDFHDALIAEGLTEVDRPGSTCPLNLLPLFRDPSPMFPHHPHLDRVNYRAGQFPAAEQVWRHTLKLPVWHREQDWLMVNRYVDAFHKVVENHAELRRTT